MDIRVYKTFLEVAKVRHFGKAAESLYITQAAVSARIKQLEEFYSSKLFIRDKSNIRLTPAGESLLDYASAIVEQVAFSKLNISLSENSQTLINIAATSNAWDAFLASRVSYIVKNSSDHGISAEISVRESIHRKLLDKNLDIAVLADPIKEDELCSEIIGNFQLQLVATSEQEGIALIENANNKLESNTKPINYFLVNWGMSYLKEHNALHKFKPLLRTTTAKIALDLMLELGGAAYLPIELAKPYIDSQQLFAINSPLNIKRNIYFTYHKNNSALEKIQKILSQLKGD